MGHPDSGAAMWEKQVLRYAQDDKLMLERDVDVRARGSVRAQSGWIEEPRGNWRVRIDPPIAQKRPVAARLLHECDVHFADQNLFVGMRCFCDDAPKWVCDKTAAPELKSRAFRTIAEHVAGFVSNAIHCRHVDAVG